MAILGTFEKTRPYIHIYIYMYMYVCIVRAPPLFGGGEAISQKGQEGGKEKWPKEGGKPRRGEPGRRGGETFYL